jgi:cysteine desulfurase
MGIYLDHNAGTPMRPAVREAMIRFIAGGGHGNPASVHRDGQRARRELEQARDRVANLIGAPARSIVFTSGGTESNNLAIFGAAHARSDQRRRIITSAMEHSSVLAPIAELESRDFEIIRVAPDCDGSVSSASVLEHVDETTALVTLALANAEVGAVAEIAPIAGAAKRSGALLHIDAAQAVGRIAVDVEHLRCDLMTVSAHKLGGPAGIGALYVRPGAAISSVTVGGPQEAGRRAGTPNLAGAIGFGAAAEETARILDEESARVAALAQTLLEQLQESIPGLRLNGPTHQRIQNTLNLTFPGVLGESMLIALDLEGVEVSMGSACAAGAVEPSHVLLAMGRSEAEARSSLRISLGWSTTAAEITRAAEIIPRVWRRVAMAEPHPAIEVPG